MSDAQELKAKSIPPENAWRPIWHPVLIALLPFLLIVGCWKADFVAYDDPMHVSENTQILDPITKILEFNPAFPYYPVTLLTYKLDHFMFAGWMPQALGSWAPGVRFMTVVYHALTALVIWRILFLLRLSRGRAFFVACAFAIHPLASETLCWTSERKNAVAALLGFLGVWAWIRWEHSIRGVIVGTLLFGLALLAKQSVLGLLPVLILFDLFGGTAGLSGKAPTCWLSGRNWLRILARGLPPTLIAVAMVGFTIHIMKHTIVPPPGGSIATALLTDIEIFARYIFNLVIPTNLSAVYMVDPIRSWSDSRIYSYGLIVAAVVAVSVRYAENPRRALFGWLWMLGSLGPNLNLISIPHLMQDRYIYLGTPGFFIVVVELVAGLSNSLKVQSPLLLSRASYFAGAAFLLFLTVVAFQRAPVWKTSLSIFQDATRKQPLAAYARFGLGKNYQDIGAIYATHSKTLSDPKRVQEIEKLAEQYRREGLKQWAIGLTCPDSPRFNLYATMALELGSESIRLNRPDEAERYWSMCLEAPKEAVDDTRQRAQALGSLAALWLDQGKASKAYEISHGALKLHSLPEMRILIARTALALAAEKQGAEATVLLNEAREHLNSVQESSEFYAAAQGFLKHPLLKRE